jgi:uncharacterized protein YgbK (DUF1537 family)
MHKFGIIADDLTGANDSGVQLVKQGLRTSVMFDVLSITDDPIKHDAVVIDTDSRAVSPEKAYQAVHQAAMFLKEHDFTQIYKKLDSTLRGNLGAEIQAVTDVFEPEFCIIVPAFPRIGRTTIQGTHFLHGVRLEETEIAHDPQSPVVQSSLCRLLESQSSQHVGLVRTKELGQDITLWRAELDKWQQQGVKWLVFDAETDAHLEWIAFCVSKITTNVVWVGSAGLAEYLPTMLGWQQVSTQQPANMQNHRVLTVSGSLSSVTSQQITKLIQKNDIQAIELDPMSVFAETTQWERKKQELVCQLSNVYAQGDHAVLYVAASPENRLSTQHVTSRLRLTPAEVSKRISQGLGQIASQLVKNEPYVSGLVLTGGDTAKDVCRQIGVSGLELIREVEAGIPLGKLAAGDLALFAITKAGAFGHENSLVNAVNELKGGAS